MSLPYTNPVRTGFLYVETSASHPGLVRLRWSERAPALPELGNHPDPELRYCARFGDVDAARMHAHAQLRRLLLNIDSGLYRTSPARAVAAIESIDLSHQRVFIDPQLNADPELEAAVRSIETRRRAISKIWEWVGWAALALLLAELLLSF